MITKIIKPPNRTLKNILCLYPVYTVLLILYPYAVARFINPDLIDTRYILIDFVWLPLFTIPAVLSKKRFILRIANLLYFIAGFISLAHWIIIRGPLSLTSLMVISNTNLNESIGFIYLKATYELLVLIPYVIIFVLAFRQPLPVFEKGNHKTLFFVVALIVALFLAENAVHGRFIRKGSPLVLKVGCSFFDKMSEYNKVFKTRVPKQVEARTLFEDIPQTFVIVIGESCSRKHMSLYGYKRKTTPRLDRCNDIFVFDNVVAAWSNTISSVLSILSEANLENGKDFATSVNVIDVFHSAGFKTYWISNQTPFGAWDNLITEFAKRSDFTKFVNVSANSSFEATLTSSYDEQLFAPLSKVLKDTAKRKFIVVHLMGSHSTYTHRYPEKFDVFHGSGKKERTIARYDNSVLYNDFVVDSMLNMVKFYAQDSCLSTVIYLSDHAENVYDEMNKVGHDYSGYLPKSNVEIPFIVWLSDHYRDTHPEKVKIILSNTHKPFVSDDLFYSIIDLDFIKTPYAVLSKSIFSKQFYGKRKRILEDHMDYDEK